MNTSGFTRGLMAKNMKSEDFLKHVGKCIEDQLKEWGSSYEVLILKLDHYYFTVIKEDQNFVLKITEEELQTRQENSPYSLDRKIWGELENQGLEILSGPGNYLSYVCGRYE